MNFAASADIFNIYLLLIISRLVFPHTIIMGQRKNSIIMFASVIELISKFILSYVFLLFWGIKGIAFATIIAYMIQKIVWIVYNDKKLNIKFNEYVPVRIFIFYSITTIIAFLSQIVF
jgi:Na+-driven multidrug efflux pump